MECEQERRSRAVSVCQCVVLCAAYVCCCGLKHARAETLTRRDDSVHTERFTATRLLVRRAVCVAARNRFARK